MYLKVRMLSRFKNPVGKKVRTESAKKIDSRRKLKRKNKFSG